MTKEQITERIQQVVTAKKEKKQTLNPMQAAFAKAVNK